MKSVLLAVSLIAVFCSLSLASTDLGAYTCPPGQVENTACAASCCAQNGGTYSYADETCEVGSDAEWGAAMTCEQQNGCCVPASGSQPQGGACCGVFFLLPGALLCATAFARR